MKNEGAFRTREQELERLIQEIADVKCAVGEISATVNRIERHVRRAFDLPKPSRGKSGRADSAKTEEPREETPTISPDRALKIFDDLSNLTCDGQGVAAEGRLQQMPIPDLRILAHELGITFRSRPSKKTLCLGIIGRLNERAMLSKNVNITQPQSEIGSSDNSARE